MKTELQQILDSINESIRDGKATREEEKAARVAMQKQLDAIDSQTKNRLAQFTATPSLVEKLKSTDSFQRLLADRRGRATLTLSGKDMTALMERKTTILESAQGFQTTGVMPIQRIEGITAEARQTLSVRDVLSSSPCALPIVDFVRVSVPLSIASPVPEGSAKPENQLSFVSLSERIRTIATWLPASKQILDDWGELGSFIQSSLPFYVNLEEELQLLSGDGTGENLHGLLPQSTPFNKALLPATGATKIDAIGAAISQVTVAKELQPTFVIMHPQDYWSMRMAKDSLGRYLMGDPQSGLPPSIFGLTIIPTVSIALNNFLVGSGNPAASEIRDKMEMQVEVSTEHQDFFVKNLVAIRAEKRLALIVKRPASYVSGTFTTVGGSPLSASA